MLPDNAPYSSLWGKHLCCQNKLKTHNRMLSTIAATASECGAKTRILVCKIQDMLWKTRGLNNTAHLDRALFLDEFAHYEKEIRRKLLFVSNPVFLIGTC